MLCEIKNKRDDMLIPARARRVARRRAVAAHTRRCRTSHTHRKEQRLSFIAEERTTQNSNLMSRTQQRHQLTWIALQISDFVRLAVSK